MIRLILAIAAMSMLSACSTKPNTTTHAVTPALYGTVKNDTATVIVTRDGGVLGSACRAKVFVDNKAVGQLKPSESVTLYIPGGRHIISFDTRGKLCPSVTDVVDVTLVKGELKKYRIRGDANGNFQLLPTL